MPETDQTELAEIQRKFEKFFSKLKEKDKLRRDFLFLYQKCLYHHTRFREEQEKFLKKEESSSEQYLMEHLDEEAKQHIKLDGKSEVELIWNIEFELNQPNFYEFDSFMIDIRRIIEFLCNIIAHFFDREEIDSVTNFFEGFSKIHNQSQICAK